LSFSLSLGFDPVFWAWMVFGGQVDKQTSHLIKVAEFCFWLQNTQKQVSPSPTRTPFFSHFALGVRYQNLSTELGFFFWGKWEVVGFCF
jgi:hypothetical protein